MILKRSEKKPEFKIKFRHKHPILFYGFLTCMISAILVISGVAWYVEKTLDTAPKITEEMLKSDGTSNIYDKNGNVIWSTTEVRRDYIKFDQVPKLYVDLLLAVEDNTFYTEGGFSKKGVFNMVTSPILSALGKGTARGGSTIKQQLVKMVAFDTSKETSRLDTINRKIQEMWLAQQLVENFSKDQILEFYINKMFLGENSYGIDTISRTYFGESISKFQEKTPENLSKLAIIAGLGQSPSAYNLYDNPDLVRKRRNIVLESALNAGVITEAQYRSTVKVPVDKDLKERYWRNNIVLEQQGKYNAYITSTLNELARLGYDLEKSPLQIHTYLDPEQYEWLTDTVNNFYYQDDLQQVAVTVMDTKTGIVIAQSGGRGEVANGLNRAIQRTRSSGSGMKPFIGYGPVIEYFGYGSNAQFDTSNYVYPGTNIVASNYGGYVYGIVDMQKALALSLNTPVNRILDTIVGSDYAKLFLSKVGLDVKDSYGGSDALGLDVSTEMTAAAYASITNGGRYNTPHYISKLIFSDGSERAIPLESTKGMNDSTAFILAKMLETTTQRNMSAERADMPEIGGIITKTGTTNYDPALGFVGDFAPDSWISGATKSVAVSIWTGYDAPNEWGHWIYVASNVKYDLYKAITRHYNAGKDTSDFAKPESVVDLGGGFYAPSSVGSSVKQPQTISQLPDMSSLIYQETRYKDQEVKPVFDKSEVPDGYNIGEWAEKLSDEDKVIYNYYRKHDGELPDFESVKGDKTYDNRSDR